MCLKGFTGLDVMLDRFFEASAYVEFDRFNACWFWTFCWTIGLGRLWPFKAWKVLNGFRQVG